MSDNKNDTPHQHDACCGTGLDKLLANNKAWAENITAQDPTFFSDLSKGQSPEFLWIGCADSRVPASEVVGLMPGELFVHRNVGNVVVPSDLNSMTVLQYAVEVLKVKHVVVCGHYGCGAVQVSLSNQSYGMADAWLHHIKDVYNKHQNAVDNAGSDDEKVARLCEFNVVEQVNNVSQSSIVQRAWQRGQELTVHGIIYSLEDGVIRDLNVSVNSADQTPSGFNIHA